ncbi:flippase, partial [Halorubrum sp. SP3]
MDDEDAHLLSNLLKGSGLVFLGMLLEVSIAFAGKLVVARIFGPVEYGVISVGTTLLTFSGIVLVLGLNSGIGRYVPRYDDASRIRGVLVSGFQIAIPLSLAAALVLFVLSPRLA